MSASLASSDSKTSGVFVFGSPVAVGHVRPLIPLARRLVERGLRVVWAISGDDNEPAARWQQQLTDVGVHFIDLDRIVKFSRGVTPEFSSGANLATVMRRVTGRANDVSAAATTAIAAAASAVAPGQPIVGGIYDYFGLWAYVAMRRLGIQDIDVVVSAFPAVIDRFPVADFVDDAVFQRELTQLRASGIGCFEEVPRGGLIPRDPALRVLNFSSPRLCPDRPEQVHLLGVQADALPRLDGASLSSEDRALLQRLRAVREGGARVVLLSMGTVVTRMFTRIGAAHVAFLRRLYSTLAAAALRAGATVVASTCDASPAELGVDEASLGTAAQDHVIAMPFVPQPLLFAHGLVDVMLMHGGANTFHEAVVSGIPVLVCPGFGDQESVALAAAKLGVGTALESITFPRLAGAVSVEEAASEVLPAMLAPGTSRWKAAADRLAAEIRQENGLDAAEALVLAARTP
jgi:UDP:flavonoid glycosyltransferase YjiC (YdhE family)